MDTQENSKEHPAKRAARMIRDMHEKTIAMIDAGHVFTRTTPQGVKDVTEKVRTQCTEQITACDAVMNRVDHMGPEDYREANEALIELTGMVQPAVDHAQVAQATGGAQAAEAAPTHPVNDSDNEQLDLPTIGGYEHREDN